MPKRLRLDRCIYKDKWGISVIGKGADGKQHETRFPSGTSLAVMQRWRNHQRARTKAATDNTLLPTIAKPLQKSTSGWCYVYFIQCGNAVKIGRAIDPDNRLRRLQIGSALALNLIAAIPAHSSLEAAIHARFDHLRTNGEWFVLDDELSWFITRLTQGVNPAILFFWSPDEQANDRSALKFEQRARKETPA